MRYLKGTVCYQFKENEFSDIDEETKGKLIKLMARIAERSYRRGFMQGQSFAPVSEKHLIKYRFFVSLDISPDPRTMEGFKEKDCYGTSINLLYQENGGFLNDLGFPKQKQ